MRFIFVFENFQNYFSLEPPFGLFWSAEYLSLGGENCEIRILSCLTQGGYTLKKLRNQILLFLLSWEPNFLIAWSTGKVFFRLTQKERFFEPIEKLIYIFNCWWAGVSNCVYSTNLVITKIYTFRLYITSVLLLIMWGQPAWIVWMVTSTAEFSHCWSYIEHADLWVIFVCISYQYSLPLWDMQIYLVFVWSQAFSTCS